MPNNEIDIDEVLKHIEYRRFINSMNLDEVTFIQNGRPIHIDSQLIADWIDVGLNNLDFIEIISTQEGRESLAKSLKGIPDGKKTLIASS